MQAASRERIRGPEVVVALFQGFPEALRRPAFVAQRLVADALHVVGARVHILGILSVAEALEEALNIVRHAGLSGLDDLAEHVADRGFGVDFPHCERFLVVVDAVLRPATPF